MAVLMAEDQKQTESLRNMLIAGLGNPGRRYRETRHNAGFLVIDRLVEALKAQTQAAPDETMVVQRARTAGRMIYLVKPVTFMNDSGVAVREMADRLGMRPEDVLVIHDCLDLPLGRIRLRRGGSSGGQRGVESVIRELGSDQFPRLRVGIGRPQSGATIEYVLSPWTAAERPLIGQSVSASAEAVVTVISAGIAEAMNQFNGWTAATDNASETQGAVSIEDV